MFSCIQFALLYVFYVIHGPCSSFFIFIRFHGPISREEADNLVMSKEGCYLTRESQRQPGSYVLVFNFSNQPRNYKLYFDKEEKMHYVGKLRINLSFLSINLCLPRIVSNELLSMRVLPSLRNTYKGTYGISSD